jgi:xanthine dehydrogenase accessory factor
MRLDLLAALNAERAARRAAVVVTELASGKQRLVREAQVDGDPLAAALRAQLRTGNSGTAEKDSVRFFLEVHMPPPRIVITGAVHVSQALAPMAKLLGYDVSIVDPRTALPRQSVFRMCRSMRNGRIRLCRRSDWTSGQRLLL